MPRIPLYSILAVLFTASTCTAVIVAMCTENGEPHGPGLSVTTTALRDENLEQLLRSQPIEKLAQRAMTLGDPARGALVYFNPELTCVRCHEPSQEDHVRLGPAIAETNRDATVEYLIESILDPSLEIAEDFRSETILTVDGEQISGLVVAEDPPNPHSVLIADPTRDGKQTRIPIEDIDDRAPGKVSAMPKGLVGAMRNEQSFLDLIRYLVEIKRGGKKAEIQLRPPASFFAVAPLPEYESRINHAGLLESLNQESYQRGEAIYQRFCARCHGTQEQEGSMPSALRFGEGAFKNGSDPFSMYQTLTHGYGLMVAQRWMVPKQKYDVIHYIRKRFLEPAANDSWVEVTADYLAQLPRGDELGPEPVDSTPWSEMDYGNFLFNTYEVGQDKSNIAYKGIAVRLDQGPGGVSQGKHWMLYEHDTMRVAAAWSGSGFIDYNGIHFNDRHNVHPAIVGDIHFSNDHRPGWANPLTGNFENDPRITGRDQVRYGPLPESWLKYRGLYQWDDRVVLEYTVGDTPVLESPSVKHHQDTPLFFRSLKVGPRKHDLLVRIASVAGLLRRDPSTTSGVLFASPEAESGGPINSFDGSRYLSGEAGFAWREGITIASRIRTRKGGTIICQTEDALEWVPGGASLFVRGGRLVFDVGWVGNVSSDRRINDGRWHDVIMTWDPDEHTVRLFIDGKLDVTQQLDPGEEVENPVSRIGYTAGNFPKPSAFEGEIAKVRVWDRVLSDSHLRGLDEAGAGPDPTAAWSLESESPVSEVVVDQSESGRDMKWMSTGKSVVSNPGKRNTWANANASGSVQWVVKDQSLCLLIPKGDNPVSLEISTGSCEDVATGHSILEFVGSHVDTVELENMILGGPPRYPDTLVSKVETMPYSDSDPFIVDYLTHPEDNPWSCRMRLTGIDFVNDDEALVCAWDGSVWRLNGLQSPDRLQWRRIASGLFQPLGIRIVDGDIYVTCRDQLVRLEDLDHDGYIDRYHAFNSDHQVTEHFHEFAMGLQTDEAGNFYYAKSARHALPALVPHHGTLLKVSADGTETTILANGFRAANGVCLNPDGSFFVTDQEGHWTPKNRINWVPGKGGFYGNMMGYHDVADSSDEAMRPPLCWITNAFDRSPGELMWVPDNTWGNLSGSLLNLSYGMGQIFVVPHESIRLNGDEQLQGGMCALPIPLFPTGVMRGRFHSDGHLYCCGMYAWAGNQQKPGGLYRVRHTDRASWLPKKLSSSTGRLTISFTDPLQRSAADKERYVVRSWDIRRTSNYGSKHFDEKELTVISARVLSDGNTLELTVPELQPTRCMETRLRIETPDGREVQRTIHNTIHGFHPDSGTR